AGPVQFGVEYRRPDAVQALTAELLRPAGADQAGLGQLVLPLLVLRARHRLRPLAVAVAASDDRAVPVGQLGQALRGVPGDPVPCLRPELGYLRTKVEF